MDKEKTESTHVLAMPIAVLELNPKHYEELVQSAHKQLHKAYLEFAVESLNQALKADPKTIQYMMQQRFLCSKSLAEHPTIQSSENDGEFSIGVMGLINGLFGVDKDGYGFIAGIWELDVNEEPVNLTGFVLLEDRLPK